MDYDPTRITFTRLLDIIWESHRSAGRNASGQYMNAIFYHDEQQKALAVASKLELEKSGKFDRPIVTKVIKVDVYYPAENYHQDYYQKNSLHYERYKRGSGRAGFIEENWKSRE